MKKLIFWVLFLATTAHSTTIFAQIKVKNAEGRMIWLLPDGSWKYAEEEAREPDVAIDSAVVAETIRVDAASTPAPKKKSKKSKKGKEVAEPLPAIDDLAEAPKPPKTRKTKKAKEPEIEQTASKKKKQNRVEKKVVAGTGFGAASKIPDCEFQTRAKDEFTKQETVILKSREFFTHTPESLRPFLRDADYITCEGQIVQVGLARSLKLHFTILSALAADDFGTIDGNSSILLKMIDGSTVTLFCSKGSKGAVDRLNNRTTYTADYLIDERTQKQLSNTEVSKIRMIWSTGYEDYEAYNLDFFFDMFDCLNSLK